MSDDKNLFLAIVLCVAVIIAWQFLFPTPEPVPTPGGEVTTQAETPAGQPSDNLAVEPSAPSTTGGTLPAGQTAAGVLTREQALANGARIRVNAPGLNGSISLTGGLIDDVQLKNYHETLDPNSADIKVLNPRGTENAYYSTFGWLQTGGSPVKLPDTKTEWTAATVGPLTVDHPVSLTWDNGAGLRFTRTFAIDENYMFTITDNVENYGAGEIQVQPFGQIARFGRPGGRPYFVLHEGMLGVFDKVLSELTYKKAQKESEGAAHKVIEEHVTTGGWLGITDKYWLAALVPDQSRQFTGRFKYYNANGATPEIFTSDFVMAAEPLSPGQTASSTSHLFAGAKTVAILSHYQKELGIVRFDLAIDWGWFFFLTKPFFWALHTLGRLIGNFGVAILLLTVCVKALFFPLANQSYAAMSKMKKIQPEMMKLRERYADDKTKQSQAIMELYKREKVNPMAGCLPVVVQIPVFFSLYKVLFVTIEMRHAPFFGWIRDLSAPDPTNIFNLFGLIPWTPPDWLPVLGIWPLIMGVTMLVQTRLNPPPADPVQEKIFLFMPIMFTIILAKFPAGLVIYWAWNNSLSITQQYIIMRRMGVEPHLVKSLKENLPKWLGRKPAPAAVKGSATSDNKAKAGKPVETMTAASGGPDSPPPHEDGQIKTESEPAQKEPASGGDDPKGASS